MGATSARPAYRSDRQREREASILRSAREELTEKGYDRVTMNALAERAGVVKKTLYNLYGSKDDLLLAAISEIIDSYRGAAGTEEPGIPSIIASRVAATRQVLETPEYADAMTKAVAQVGPDHNLINVLIRGGVEFNTRHLRVAETNGELAAGTNVETLATHITSQGWGVTLLCMKGMIAREQLEQTSLEGLALILLSVVNGPRRQLLNQLITQTRR